MLNQPPILRCRRGFTIVELLIVIAILSIVTAIVVPQVRMVSKERGLRESSRIVGTFFGEAVSKARADGFAGVAILRNPRMIRDVGETNMVYYAGTTLAHLKKVPPYIGNTESDFATILPGTSVARIPLPFDVGLADELTSRFVGSFIQFGTNPTKYAVVNVAPDGLANLLVTFAPRPHQPTPFGNHSFRVWRRPKISLNSYVTLPPGYMINLNYSGHLGPMLVPSDYCWTTFSQPVTSFVIATPEEVPPVLILFNELGGVDRIYPNGWDDGFYRPNAGAQLCITADSIGNTFLGNPMPQSYLQDRTDLLTDPSLMWVTVSHDVGTVNEAYGVPAVTNMPMAGPYQGVQQLRMLESQRIASRRRLAEQ